MACDWNAFIHAKCSRVRSGPTAARAGGAGAAVSAAVSAAGCHGSAAAAGRKAHALWGVWPARLRLAGPWV